MIREQRMYLFGKLLWFHTCITFPPIFSLANRDICIPSSLPASSGELSSPPIPPSLMSCGCTSRSGNEPQRTARQSWTAVEAETVRAWQEQKNTFPNGTATTWVFRQKAANSLFWTPHIGLLMIHNPAPDASGPGPGLILVPSSHAQPLTHLREGGETCLGWEGEGRRYRCTED